MERCDTASNDEFEHCIFNQRCAAQICYCECQNIIGVMTDELFNDLHDVKRKS